MAGHADWSGTLNRLRLDLPNNADSNGALIELDWREVGNTQPSGAPILHRFANAAGNLVGTAVGSDPQIGNNHLFALERDAERFPIPRGATTGPPVTVITQAGAADEITVIIPHSPGGRSFARIGIEIPFQP